MPGRVACSVLRQDKTGIGLLLTAAEPDTTSASEYVASMVVPTVCMLIQVAETVPTTQTSPEHNQTHREKRAMGTIGIVPISHLLMIVSILVLLYVLCRQQEQRGNVDPDVMAAGMLNIDIGVYPPSKENKV